MARLILHNQVPNDERYTVYIDGMAYALSEAEVPEHFHLKLEQFRTAADAGETKGFFKQLLAGLALGGRSEWGREMESPDRAVWEADLEVQGDGELWISLQNTDGQILFHVDADNAAVWNERSERVVDPKAKRRWILMLLPLLLIMGAVCITLIVLVWTTMGDLNEELRWIKPVLLTVFTVLPITAMVLVSRFLIGRLDPEKNAVRNKKENLIRRARVLTRVTRIAAVLFFLTAVSMVLLPLLWGIDDVFFLPFPCAALFILVMWFVVNVTDDLPYLKGEEAEEGNRLKKSRNWMIAGFAIVILLCIASSAIADIAGIS